MAASHAVTYLERGWAVAVVARIDGAGRGPGQRSRILRELALLAATTDAAPADPRPRRPDRVLVVPAGVAARGRLAPIVVG
ncbi:MAG: hypothetical protein R3B06_13005 [Kofleriaceae bacterium]